MSLWTCILLYRSGDALGAGGGPARDALLRPAQGWGILALLPCSLSGVGGGCWLIPSLLRLGEASPSRSSYFTFNRVSSWLPLGRVKFLLSDFFMKVLNVMNFLSWLFSLCSLSLGMLYLDFC